MKIPILLIAPRFLKSISWVIDIGAITFEKEAYDNMYKEDYLKNRKLFSWRKYKV